MNTPFTVDPKQLEDLSPNEAVDLFRELLWAEASAMGIGKNLVNVPSAITVSDGGIDASVEGVGGIGGQGVIKQGYTAYQIKTGKYSLRNDSNVRGILFKPNSTELSPRVKSCLDKGGTFVVVLFGWDDPEKSGGEFVQRLKAKLTKHFPIYSSASIEVWQPNHICGFLEPYPSLRMKALRQHGQPFQTRAEWSKWADMSVLLTVGADQERFIRDLTGALRADTQLVQVRVTGEPGIGKTRLVLEATSTDDIAPLTIYFESPEALYSSRLINHVLLPDDDTQAVLVVDECDPEQREKIWNRLQSASPRIKLITIYGEPETSGAISFLNPQPLADEQITSIISNYHIPPDQAQRWVTLCSGSPRVAHMIGKHLSLYPEAPEEILRSPNIVHVWKRYIAGRHELESVEFQKRKNVLMWISLFRHIGFGLQFAEEARQLAAKIEYEEHYTWREFQQVVRYLRQCRILQGQTTLYITPKLLHIWLWAEWWETYGKGEIFDLAGFAIVNPEAEEKSYLPSSLMEGFLEMFRYAAGSDTASALVRDLLSPSGPISFDILNTERGSSFFRVLAEADPPRAMACLSHLIGSATKDELLALSEGRRAIVWTLEGLAIWRELFVEAARLLLALGEAENETWSNNASGVFVDLFSPAPGEVAPTEASPEERFPVLQEALTSESKEKRLLGLRACRKALQTDTFTRTIGLEVQGLHHTPKRWQPMLWEELFDAYQRVWHLVSDQLDNLPDDEKQEGVDILISCAGTLARRAQLTDMVFDTLNRLADMPDIDRRPILAKAIRILRYNDRLPEELRVRWIALNDRLTGTDFSSLLRRYVGMDLLEDQVNARGESEDRLQEPIKNLAQQAIDQPALLEHELGWLSTSDAKNGYPFGYELGKRDDAGTLLPLLIQALARSGTTGASYLLGGYLHAYHERDPEQWEELLDKLEKDNDTAHWVAELTWRTGAISDRAGIRVLRLAESGHLAAAQLSMFTLGSVVRNLSVGVFERWIQFLLAQTQSGALSAALDLYNFYYVQRSDGTSMPEGITFDLLTHPVLFGTPQPFVANTMDDYHWTEIGKHFVQQFPERSVELANVMLTSMGEDGAITSSFHATSLEVLNMITELRPNEVWETATRYFGPPIDVRAYHIRSWLHGDMFELSTGAISLIPAENIWAWVDADVKNRAWSIAGIVPKYLFHDRDRVCLARELLVRYGDQEKVRREFFGNYLTGGWSGPESQHYEQDRQELLAFKKEETNSNVLRWINDFTAGLEKQIEAALAQEEREL